MWSTDYLKSLPCLVPHFKERGCPKVGSIVLIHEDNTKRLDWVLGRIVELLPGSDGRIRCVKLVTAKGHVTRTVQRLHKLEFLDPPEELVENVAPVDTDVGENRSDDNVPYVTKFGRTRKPVVKLNI